MASSSGPALNEELQCSICLEVFTDPVTTPCGHNFCKTCLSECWTNTQISFCPLCKERFSRRPDLKINTTLREVVQHFEKLKLGESEVFCDICDERKQKAVKSCLTCQISYCDSHLEPHLRVLRLKKHKLINAVENLEDYICQKHESPLEMFCRDDQTSVCDSDVNVNSLYNALSLLKKTLDGTLNKKLSQTGSQLSHALSHHLHQSPRLKFVQKYAVDVTLDPDTANPYLILSDDGKQVSHGYIKQNVPKNPKRLADRSVLAKQGFSSGRFYYEVQVKGKTGWGLGVARESINRKGDIAAKPKNGVWILMLINGNQYIACDDPYVSLSLRVKPEKVGVFVDYEEDLVSFYDVGSGSHIYSFTGQTFTDKLYPGFDPCLNDKGKNSKPLIITPVS